MIAQSYGTNPRSTRFRVRPGGLRMVQDAPKRTHLRCRSC